MKGWRSMREKNVDKIKRLELELGRHRKKVADQERALALMSKTRETYEGGVAELNKAANALCIAVAVKYGTEVGDGAREAVLPEIRVEELLGGYELAVRADERTGTYIIRAKARGKDSSLRSE